MAEQSPENVSGDLEAANNDKLGSIDDIKQSDLRIVRKDAEVLRDQTRVLHLVRPDQSSAPQAAMFNPTESTQTKVQITLLA